MESICTLVSKNLIHIDGYNIILGYSTYLIKSKIMLLHKVNEYYGYRSDKAPLCNLMNCYFNSSLVCEKIQEGGSCRDYEDSDYVHRYELMKLSLFIISKVKFNLAII